MFQPKKSLGQNFLIDKNISNKIIDLIKNHKNKNIIEIGPGKGALTDLLILKKKIQLILIEKDKVLFHELSHKYKNNKNILIYNDDALVFNFNKIQKPKTLIANLPYNISIKLIINFLKIIEDFDEIILMIQKEVAEKMNYKKNLKKNRLNVLTELTVNFDIKFFVSKNVFFPKPKVNSAVIKMLPKKKYKVDVSVLEEFTKILFQKKRKKIINVLPKDFLNKIKYNKNLNYKKIIDSRAEDLNIDIIYNLFKLFWNV